VFVIIALYLRLSYILLRTQRLLESSEDDTTIILSGYRIFRQNNSEHTDVQSGSYAHTSESKTATPTVQRLPQSSKLKKVSTDTSWIQSYFSILESNTLLGFRTDDDVSGSIHVDLDHSYRHSYLSRDDRQICLTCYQLHRQGIIGFLRNTATGQTDECGTNSHAFLFRD
jgi:hypothetical protein